MWFISRYIIDTLKEYQVRDILSNAAIWYLEQEFFDIMMVSFDNYDCRSMKSLLRMDWFVKAFFWMLVEKSIEWAKVSVWRKRIEKRWKGKWKGAEKFTVGHAREVKSATKNLCPCLCLGMVKWTPSLFVERDGENTRQNDPSTNYVQWWIYNLSLLFSMKHCISI